MDSLSPQELEVVGRIARGEPYKLIAEDLEIAVRTVEVYAQRAKVKLQAKTVTHLAVLFSVHHRQE
jgi:DNA-binding CsgD family transcriptional regulator